MFFSKSLMKKKIKATIQILQRKNSFSLHSRPGLYCYFFYFNAKWLTMTTLLKLLSYVIDDTRNFFSKFKIILKFMISSYSFQGHKQPTRQYTKVISTTNQFIHTGNYLSLRKSISCIS